MEYEFIQKIFDDIQNTDGIPKMIFNFNLIKTDNIFSFHETAQGQIEVQNINKLNFLYSSSFYSNENLNLYLIKTDSDGLINSVEKFNDKINYLNENYDGDERVSFKIECIQNLNTSLNDRIELYYFYNKHAESIVDIILSNFKVKNISGRKYKLDIIGSKDINCRSSIFRFIDRVKEIENFDSEIENLIKMNEFQEKTLFEIPFLICSKNEITESYLEKCVDGLLKLLFDNKAGDDFQLFKKNIKSVRIRTFPSDYSVYYENLSKLVIFVYGEEKHYREKLSIVKGMIFDSISEDENFEIDALFWDRLLKESQNEYMLFVDDKVTKFISEKKEIIKEQFNLSNQIISQINDLKKTLINNLITISGIFLSKFFLEALSKMDDIYSEVAFKIATLYSLFLLINYLISGEYSSYKKFEKRVTIMNKYYPKLYLTDDNIISDLEVKISNPDIKELKRINIMSGFVYLSLFLFCFIKTDFGIYIYKLAIELFCIN